MDLLGLRPPNVLNFYGNVADNWKRWKQAFLLFVTASGSTEKPENVKCALLLNLIGEEGQQLYNTFTLSSEEKEKLNVVLQKFEDYCIPRRNLTHERYKLNSRSQKSTETFDQFFTEIQLLSKTCEYGELNDSLIKDRIVCGIRDDGLRERLLRVTDLDLTKALNICRTAEQAKEQLQELKNGATEDREMHRIRQEGNFKKNAAKNSTSQSSANNRNTNKFKPKPWTKKMADCQRCGRSHEEGKCPAFGAKCNKCGKMNHYAVKCRAKRIAQVGSSSLQQSEIQEEYFVGSVHGRKETTKNDWYTFIKVQGKSIKIKMDTGADVSIMTLSTFEKIKRKGQKMEESKVQLKGFGGSKIPVKGKVTVMCRNKETLDNVTFYLTETNESESILGGNDCEKLGLLRKIAHVTEEHVKAEKESGEARVEERVAKEHMKAAKEPGETREKDRDWVMKEFGDVFQGIGCVPFEYCIQVDPNIPSVQHAPRRIPLAMMTKLKNELERMVGDGIISPVTEPTSWVSSVTVVEKSNGAIRVCLDPRDLNKAILREHYQTKTLDEIASKVHGAVKFSVLDANCGFWQVPLKKECRHLTTFNTPFGRFQYNRVPFGISSAPEVFNRTIQQIFEGLEGIDEFTDDILVYGATDEEHDARLRETLEKARENNLKLNEKKCRFGLREVRYLGHKWNQEGLQVTDDKITAITKMETPTSKQELLRFLGMINYLSRFLPNLAQQTISLRKLTKKEAEWVWTNVHEEEFKRLKQMVTKAPVLRFFNPNERLCLQVDASKDGLGAALTQNGQPIAYASKMMSTAQQRYAQIEKETLSIVFGCEKFHHLIYGRKVLVESDHKPLENILKKSLEDAPPRIQRLLLKLQKYDLEVTYLPGKQMLLADTLSRAPIKEVLNGCEELRIHCIMNQVEEEMNAFAAQKAKSVEIKSAKLQEIVSATKTDTELQLLMKILSDGWPDEKQDLPKCLHEFYQYRGEISEINGLIYKGEKIIIPKSMRSDMLQALHQGHWGLERSKQRARSVMFWPGMNAQVHEMISKCGTCLAERNRNQKEPMVLEEIPERPWKKVASDLFEWNKREYLIVVDYYSGYPELAKLANMKSATVIRHLKSIFARHGIPSELRSDNGTQYKSHEFMEFIRTWKIQHTTSSPEYSQANGLAERTVQTVKQMLTKCFKDNTDPYLGLLEYRNTPIIGEYSPAQLLMNRRLNSILPETEKMLASQVPKKREVIRKKRERQTKQEFYYNRGSRKLPDMKVGDKAAMRKNNRWTPVTVKDKAEEPRSFWVETPEGNRYRRNRRHLILDSSQPVKDDSEMADVTSTSSTLNTASEEQSQVCLSQEGSTTPPYRTRSGRLVQKPKRYQSLL